MFEKSSIHKNEKGLYKDKAGLFKKKNGLKIPLIFFSLIVLLGFLILQVSCCFSFNLNSSPSTEEQQFWNETASAQTDTCSVEQA
jgi:hypothetical protein